jgi:hypothetical protein
LEVLIRALQQTLPDQLHLDAVIREALEEGRRSFQQNVAAAVAGEGACFDWFALYIAGLAVWE